MRQSPERKTLSHARSPKDSGEFEIQPEPKTRTIEPKPPTVSQLKKHHAQLEEASRHEAEQAHIRLETLQLEALRKRSAGSEQGMERINLERETREIKDLMARRPPAATEAEWQKFLDNCNSTLERLEEQLLHLTQKTSLADENEKEIQALRHQLQRLESYGYNQKNRPLTKWELEDIKKQLAVIDKAGPLLKQAALRELHEHKPWFWFLNPNWKAADKYFSPTFVPEGLEKERDKFERAVRANFPNTLERFRRACRNINRRRKGTGMLDRYIFPELEQAYADFYSVDTAGKRQEIERELEALK